MSSEVSLRISRSLGDRVCTSADTGDARSTKRRMCRRSIDLSRILSSVRMTSFRQKPITPCQTNGREHWGLLTSPSARNCDRAPATDSVSMASVSGDTASIENLRSYSGVNNTAFFCFKQLSLLLLQFCPYTERRI